METYIHLSGRNRHALTRISPQCDTDRSIVGRTTGSAPALADQASVFTLIAPKGVFVLFKIYMKAQKQARFHVFSPFSASFTPLPPPSKYIIMVQELSPLFSSPSFSLLYRLLPSADETVVHVPGRAASTPEGKQ